MAALKPNTAKSKNKISDIASMFGGMAKMKKVRTPRRLKQKKLDEEEDLLRKKMEALKHVDDSKKNQFANHLSSQNVFDFNLRKSPQPHKDNTNKKREASPMPQSSALPNDIIISTSYTSTSASSASESEETNHTQKKTKQSAIDYNLVRDKLRRIEHHSEEIEIEDEHIDIEDNPTPQSTANASLTKHGQHTRNASWSSSKSNQDTDIDDISSTRSNSINKQNENETKPMVITVNDQQQQMTQLTQQTSMEWLGDNETDKLDYHWLGSAQSSSDDASSLSSSDTESDSSSSSIMSSDTVHSDTEDDDDDNGSDRDGLHSHHRSVSLKHKIKKRNFGSSISINTTSDHGDLDEDLAAIYLMDPEAKKTEKRASSAMAGQTWSYDELFGDGVQIGAIKTPKFNKAKWRKEKEKKEQEKAKEKAKRATSANGWKQWDYESLFGDGVQIGAIKTPKFDKQKWKKEKQKQKRKEHLQTNQKKEPQKRPSSAMSWKKWSYDELFADDVQIGAIKTPKFDKEKWREQRRKNSLNQSKHEALTPRTRKRAASAFTKRNSKTQAIHTEDIEDKIDRKCDAIAESVEDNYFFDTHYDTSSQSEEDDDEYYGGGTMGDITPATPDDMPQLPPLNTHNLSINSSGLSMGTKHKEIAMIEEGDEEEETEEEEAETEGESHLERLMELFGSSSDDEFEPPQPAKSAFEKERAEIQTDDDDDDDESVVIRQIEQIETDESSAIEEEEDESVVIRQIDEDDDVIQQAIQKRNSLEDEMDSDDMEKEDNEPLGDEEVIVNSDSEEEYEDDSEDEEHEVDTLRLKQLMCEFRMNPSQNAEFAKLFLYFSTVLRMEYGSDLVNHAPQEITQPDICRTTKARKLLSKMAKYVTNQVLHNYWSGSHAAEWAELETNKLTFTFGAQRSVKDKEKKEEEEEQQQGKAIFFEECESNRVKLGRWEDRFIDREIALNEAYSVTFSIEDFPQINTKSKAIYVLNIGVQFYDKSAVCHTVSLSDRCCIYCDDKYVQNLSLYNSQMIESRSQVVVHCDNKANNPLVTFEHWRNNKLLQNNTKTIQLSGFRQTNQPTSFAKIYIKQAYGNGTYSVTETLMIHQQHTTHTVNV